MPRFVGSPQGGGLGVVVVPPPPPSKSLVALGGGGGSSHSRECLRDKPLVDLCDCYLF